MRRCSLVLVALFAIAHLNALAETTTQSAELEEWFVYNGGLSVHAESASFDRLSPETGQRTVVADWGSRPSDVRRRFVLNDRGRAIELNATLGDRSEEMVRGYWRPNPNSLVDFRRMFEDAKIKGLSSASLSPDSRKLVVFDFLQKILVIGNSSLSHRVPIAQCPWDNSFCWNPDSTTVAFYYNDCSEGGDVSILKNGLAVLSVDGRFREVVPLSKAVPTPRLFAKFVPPEWDPSGEFIYYTNGVLQEDAPPTPERSVSAEYSPAATYRVNVNTGASEFIAHGAFADMSPDGKYLLLYPCPKPAPEGKWTLAAAKVDMGTRQITYLPDEVRWPKISPSGKLVACLDRKNILFFQTSDWKTYGKPFPRGTDAEIWAKAFRWIVVDKPDEKK